MILSGGKATLSVDGKTIGTVDSFETNITRDYSDDVLVRFRDNPVGFIREVYPDVKLDEYQIQALEWMGKNPDTRIRLRDGQYVIELTSDITKEMSDSLFENPSGVVQSWSVDPKSREEIIDDIKSARKIFETKVVASHRYPSMEEFEAWRESCVPVDSSRQAFKAVAGKKRRKR